MTRFALLLLVVIGAVLLVSSVYVLDETEQAILTQFGEPVGGAVTVPGLHFKVPFIRKVHRFDRRFLEWEGAVAELPTKDKVFILVDTYARWRITDPLKFFKRVRNERGAQSRLDDILDGETRNAIAKHVLLEVIRTSNRQPVEDPSAAGVGDELATVEDGREEIRRQILASSKRRVHESDLGIEILDVQFKRINYGQSVLQDVYNRMISERKRISDRYRSEGQGLRAKILGDMDRELKRIESEAYRQAEEIRGRSDAEATEVYASAYDRSADSRRFYEFLKTMETFRATTDQNTSLLLSTEGDFYRFLRDSGR